MNPLQQSLAAADESYLIGMSNKGIYKRACKDLESGEISMQPKEDSLEVSVSGEICSIKDPLWESSCSCPSRTVCRHLITAILWLRENYQDEAESPGNQEIPENPEIPEQDAEAGLPDLLKQTLSGIALPELRKSLGSHAGMLLSLVQEQKIPLEESSILSGIIPDQNQTTVKILYPLEYSSCSCRKKDLCAHKAAVILAWQLKEAIIRPEDLQEQMQNLSPEESGIIRENAKRSYALLCDVLRWGLVRMPDNLAEHLEAAAVQSHALKMADAERMLREIGNKLSECRERRAVFNPELFLQKLCTCAEHLRNLQKEQLSAAELGQFRKVYEEQIQDLEILPVGQRKINTPEYQGNIYYFLDLDHNSRRFLCYSEVRPVFYENQKKNAYYGSVTPWNANSPMKTLMYDKMILRNAKISDGKLSGSKDTLLLSQTKANLDCDAIRELLYTDFRKLAVDLSEKKSDSETDRLCFVSPAVCLSSAFDTHSQYYQMLIADHAGNVIQIRSRYKAEQKKFIELLERIGSEMLENPDKNFVWLCSAYFENGRLHLYPIEVYDFIRIPEHIPEYKLPEIYSHHKPWHVIQIFTLLQDVQNDLCEALQSGLQSADARNVKRFQEKAERFGMYGFSNLLQNFIQSLESSRHAMQDTMQDTVENYRQIWNYIAVGMKKLEILSALDAMKPEN